MRGRTGRPCACCTSSDRDAIDQALIDPSVVVPALSRRFTVSEDSLLRHRRSHLPRALRRAGLEAASEAEGIRGAALTAQAASLRDRALGLLDEAERSGDMAVAVRAVRETRETIALLAKLSGDLVPDTTTINLAVLASPGWAEVQATLLAALSRHPEARRDVVAALERISA